MPQCVIASPVGALKIVSEQERIIQVSFSQDAPDDEDVQASSALVLAVDQIRAYFQGKRKTFSLPLTYGGSGFQHAVWDALANIPYGETRSYGELAQILGKPGAARAVGQAVHRNPIAILLPCHRVIGMDGRLVGFGGGLDKKRFLLEHEQKHWK